MYLTDELKLPEMQRKYVWTSPKVRDLVDCDHEGHDYMRALT